MYACYHLIASYRLSLQIIGSEHENLVVRDCPPLTTCHSIHSPKSIRSHKLAESANPAYELTGKVV